LGDYAVISLDFENASSSYSLVGPQQKEKGTDQLKDTNLNLALELIAISNRNVHRPVWRTYAISGKKNILERIQESK
jgi:hypothetical protein